MSSTTSTISPPQPAHKFNRGWYGRWVGANALAELLGLGTTAVLGYLLAETLSPISFALLMILGGVLVEGVLVGLLQWSVLRRLWPNLGWRAWSVATAVGAGIAWSLGMLPSTLMNMEEASSGATAPIIPDWQIYLLAIGMGLVLGPILGLAQWWVLRRHVARALWWLPANALAWGVGMLVIFVAAGNMGENWAAWQMVAFGLTLLALAGAAVGAVHGLFLLWLSAPST
jgi:hypothetical protein